MKRSNWTLEDALYDCLCEAVHQHALAYFRDNKELFDKVFSEFFTEENIRHYIENFNFEERMGEQMMEFAKPILQKRLDEIAKLLA